MASRSDRVRRFGPFVETWNRRFHYYLGLYFLLFIWLFSFTGLLLNHPRWTWSRIPNDPSPPYERAIATPAGETDQARAADVVRQLNLRGETDWPPGPAKPGADVQSRVSETGISDHRRPCSESRDGPAGGSKRLVGVENRAHVQRLAL